MNFGFSDFPGVSTGIKLLGTNTTPGSLKLFNVCDSFLPSIQGAPIHLNGLGVHLPSLTFVPSNRHIPGYIIAVLRSGIFGEGATHGRSV